MRLSEKEQGEQESSQGDTGRHQAWKQERVLLEQADAAEQTRDSFDRMRQVTADRIAKDGSDRPDEAVECKGCAS